MSGTPILMEHDLVEIPSYALPDQFRFRFYEQEKDEAIWCEIVTATDEFPNETAAWKRFEEEFKPYKELLSERMIFIETEQGQTVGTATAWFGNWQGDSIGRLHWIEVLPSYQGQGLGKPLISYAMQVLAQFHTKAYLKTQTTSEAAVHIYQKFGWKIV